MELEDTGLFLEIDPIMKMPQPMPYSLSAVIHTVANGKNVAVMKVISMDVERDYEMNYADKIMIEMMIPSGVFAGQVYPYQGNLDITVYKTAMFSTGSNYDMQSVGGSERYTAVMVDIGDDLTEGNYGGTPSQQAMDLLEFKTVTFQLIDKSLEQLRMASFGANFRNTTAADALKAVMTKESMNVDLPNNRRLKGVQMAPPSNTKVREHVNIPQGIPLVEIPMHIQNNCGGVYSAGMGYYLQGDFWHIFPCFDTTRFTTAKKTLTIIRVPPKSYPGIERTWRVAGDNLVVLANGEVEFRSDADAQQLTRGNGVRFADASKMMEKFSEGQGNRSLASRGDTNSEFAVVQRGNGKNNIQISDNPITSNQMVELSKLTRRNGSVMAFLWQNSESSLILPGMPVRILYLVNAQIKELYGVILKTHHYTRMLGEGMMAERHTCDSMLSVFIQGSKTK